MDIILCNLMNVIRSHIIKMREKSQRCVFFGVLFTVVVIYVSWTMISKQLINPTDRGDTLLRDCHLDHFKLSPSLDHADPCLIAFFKKKMLIPPRSPESVKTVPFSRLQVEVPCNIEKLKWVQMLLMDGAPKDTQFFFVESGAHDGRFLSTTLRLETLFGWNGVLIEPMPDLFQKLLKNRKVWAVNAALSGSVTPHPDYGPGVPCVPLYTILAALNVDVVDFLSLDVEKSDLLVLKTVPFDKVKFKVIMVEYPHIPGNNKIGQFVDLLGPKGYLMIANITMQWCADLVFIHESVYRQKKSIIIII